jgi:hypothetical protein
MRHNLSAFLFLFLAHFSATAQDTKPTYDYDKIWAFQANAGWQQSIFIEAGISRQWQKSEHIKSSGEFIRPISFPFSVLGANAHLGGYYDFSSQQFLLGAHLGGEYYRMPQKGGLIGFAARLSASTYISPTNPDGVDIHITPQVGITALTIFSVFYGYSQPILSDHISAIGRHRIIFAFSIPFPD